MIKFNEQVPSVYPTASRDFQYLSWLMDIVLNSVKHNVDSLYDLPNAKTNARLTELLAMTLGFKVKRNYDQKQLAALVAVLPRILKYKGTEIAVNIAGNALIAASGALGIFSVSKATGGELEVVLPENLIDISLFTDLLPYILPAGMTCRIIRTNQIAPDFTPIRVGYHDTLLAEWVPDLEWNLEDQKVTGLANMFDDDGTDPEFTSFKNADSNTPNLGLLDNSIIPMLATPMSSPEVDFFAVSNEQGETVIINKHTSESNDDGGTTAIIGGE